MNIDIIKNKIKSLVNKKIKIKINLGRNKCEYFDGYIDKIYTNIFLVKTSDGSKTFSYSDIANKQVTISKFE